MNISPFGHGPFPHVQKGRGGAVDVNGHPVLVAVDDLGAGPDHGGGGQDRGRRLSQGFRVLGVSVMTLPDPKLTPPLVARAGHDQEVIGPHAGDGLLDGGG